MLNSFNQKRQTLEESKLTIVRLDRLDVAVLRELTQAQMVLPGRPGMKPSNREISRKLRVPPATVRYRLKGMYNAGIIKGSSVFPNPNLLGLKMGAYTLDVPPMQDKDEVVRRLSMVDGAVNMHNFVGSLVWVTFLYENDLALERKMDEMNEAAGAQGILSHVPFPPCTATLTRQEAALIIRLSERGFDSYGALARELGISVRTLERRLSKLARTAAVISLPNLDYHKIKGSVPADLLILFMDSDAAKMSQKTILPLVGETVIFAALWDVVGLCSLILPNVASAGELAEKVRRVEGVATARVEIVRDHVDRVGLLGSYFEKRMETEGPTAYAHVLST